ncbi:MAG TPA: trehalose-phosphatase, partial [Geminicoccaceae bacterium]|nr:trehalose-phosphatase [Geminicoccaceae bacterium]
MPVPLPAPPDLRVDAIALFLDVDGTLVEIEREPGAVHVPERLRRILAHLCAATGGALALVSGRSLD